MLSITSEVMYNIPFSYYGKKREFRQIVFSAGPRVV
jgi:hypothetical protein